MSQESPTGVNPARIKKRIKGREKAKELLASIHHSVLKDPEVMEALLEELRTSSVLGKTPTTTSSTKPAPKRSIQSVGAQLLNFGQYRGHTLDETPLSYLDNLLSLIEDSQHLLHEYLTHPDLRSYRDERRISNKR